MVIGRQHGANAEHSKAMHRIHVAAQRAGVLQIKSNGDASCGDRGLDQLNRVA